MAANWDEVLRELDARLDQYREVLGGGAEPEPYDLPEGLGPLPVHLESRARVILEAQHDVENELRNRLGVLGALLHTNETHTDSPAPVFIDTRL